MKSTKSVTETIILGDGGNEIRLVRQRENDEPLAKVVVHGWELDLPPEDIERVAAALERARNDEGDYRRACPDHGYFKPRGIAPYGCPTCHAVEEVASLDEARAS